MYAPPMVFLRALRRLDVRVRRWFSGHESVHLITPVEMPDLGAITRKAG